MSTGFYYVAQVTFLESLLDMIVEGHRLPSTSVVEGTKAHLEGLFGRPLSVPFSAIIAVMISVLFGACDGKDSATPGTR